MTIEFIGSTTGRVPSIEDLPEYRKPTTGVSETAFNDWRMPDVYYDRVESAKSASVEEARTRLIVVKYRRLLETLPLQTREGDPAILLRDLAAREEDIREAENLLK